jgi:hypothetical protein
VKSIVDEVNNKYNAEIIFLDKKVHNGVIFNLADSIITSCGTIAIEAVPHGVPVLVASYPPYEKANIVIQPHSIDEYKNYLMNIEKIPKPSNDVMERAKLCFLLYSKYFFVFASFLHTVSPMAWTGVVSEIKRDRGKNFSIYNQLYKTNISLDDEPLYKMFSYMIDKHHHDTIDILAKET